MSYVNILTDKLIFEINIKNALENIVTYFDSNHILSKVGADFKKLINVPDPVAGHPISEPSGALIDFFKKIKLEEKIPDPIQYRQFLTNLKIEVAANTDKYLNSGSSGLKSLQDEIFNKLNQLNNPRVFNRGGISADNFRSATADVNKLSNSPFVNNIIDHPVYHGAGAVAATTTLGRMSANSDPKILYVDQATHSQFDPSGHDLAAGLLGVAGGSLGAYGLYKYLKNKNAN